MSDALIRYFQETLPPELVQSLQDHLRQLKDGEYQTLLSSPLAQELLHNQEDRLDHFDTWSDYIVHRLGRVFASRNPALDDGLAQSQTFKSHLVFIIGLAALSAFLQSSVTGPPLNFAPARLLCSKDVSGNAGNLLALREKLVHFLGSDGVAAYALIPNVELFCLADAIVDYPAVRDMVKASSWAKLRVDFLHQRLLSEVAPSLETAIYRSLEKVDSELQFLDSESRAAFLLERASIHTHHGLDKKARADLDAVVPLTGFQFALIGRLGKRTKFQDRDISQLVVLAKSRELETSNGGQLHAIDQRASKVAAQEPTKPKNLDLNDDTLLESISFVEKPQLSTDVQDEGNLPLALMDLDPSNQPILQPLDSVALLSLASSIKNTSPEDGLTREETLPYATRVLEGGSSNWQIYTQALLVRSRIEGYRSRTMERGLLQLQALVDQIIAETTNTDAALASVATTFLPRAKESESAPVQDRLRFVFQLASPSRWEIEAELAARWVSMGGLRSALEIYERLQMWPEVALCWAATERDDKARKIARRQLFHASDGKPDGEVEDEDEKWEGEPREPPPADAARLYCILGDLDRDPDMYEKAWDVSHSRYARAQRSLGRFHFARKEYAKSVVAYEKSLKANQLNGPSWFALGCALLETAEFERAVAAFTRTVQLDDSDAEAWSNLAAALLSLDRKDTRDKADGSQTIDIRRERQDESTLAGDGVDASPTPLTPAEQRQKHRRDALNALKQASRLKYDNHRILDNLLTVAASTVPPSYKDVVFAQRRLIELRGPSEGERCIDEDILDHLVRYVVDSDAGDTEFDPAKPGLARMVVDMVDQKVVPLITASARLWRVVARLALWRRKPSSALDAHEKAWRAVTSQPGWDCGTESQWNRVVDATVELVDAYESLGGMEKNEGLAAGSGELVMRDWKFKARSIVRSIMGRGKGSWEGNEGWTRLEDCLGALKGA